MSYEEEDTCLRVAAASMSYAEEDNQGKETQFHKASLLPLDVDRSNGCRTRGECWAVAGCVDRTDHVQLQRPPGVCMLMHARLPHNHAAQAQAQGLRRNS